MNKNTTDMIGNTMLLLSTAISLAIATPLSAQTPADPFTRITPPVSVKALPVEGRGEDRKAGLEVTNNGDQAISEFDLGIVLRGEDGSVKETIPHTRLRVGVDIAFASLDVPDKRPDVGGIVQNHRLVGTRAMEQLSLLVRTFHRGPPEAPSATYVPGYWRDGASVKAKVRTHHPFALTA